MQALRLSSVRHDRGLDLIFLKYENDAHACIDPDKVNQYWGFIVSNSNFICEPDAIIKRATLGSRVIRSRPLVYTTKNFNTKELNPQQ